MSEPENNVVQLEIKKLKETTIGEMGVKLAVGSPNGDRTLVLREMLTADERVISKKVKKTSTMGEQVSAVLAQMVERLGEWDLTTASPAEKQVRIAQLYMGDVLLAFIHLRMETMGPTMGIEMLCPCQPEGKSFRIGVDLNSTKVTYVTKEEDLIWHYQLEKPRKWRDKLVTSLTMKAPRWGGIMGLTGAMTQREVTINGLRSGVVGFNGEYEPAFICTEDEFDQIHRLDLEGIEFESEKNMVGPTMAVECKCP
jgi:hypothetical protein